MPGDYAMATGYVSLSGDNDQVIQAPRKAKSCRRMMKPRPGPQTI